MCQSIAQGGLRCAAHTRPAYQTAPFGTPEWDTAAAAYASTPTGRVELMASLAAAEAAEDVRSAVAFEHALGEGARIREKADLFRSELEARASDVPPAAPVAVSALLGDDEEEPDGYYALYEDDDEDDGWDDEPGTPWSPSMAGARWDEADPAFRSCTPSMTANEFIEQVCANHGVTRGDFEEAAAEYFRAQRVAMVLPSGESTTTALGTSGGDAARLRALVCSAAVPAYTPEQVKAIAELAKQRQAEQAAFDAEVEAVAGIPALDDGVGGIGEQGFRMRRYGAEVSDDPQVLDRLASHPLDKVREAVALHENTPVEMLQRLAADSKAQVRGAAARNPRLPLATLLPLRDNRSVMVRAGAARNPQMPVEHLRTLAQDANENVRGAVARNPSTPDDLYEALAGSESGTVRKHAARRKDIPAGMVERLRRDPEAAVRGTLAQNRTVGAGSLRLLVRDGSASVREKAVRNPNFPPSLLSGRISRDPAAGVRAAVARHASTPVTVLARLTADSDPWVRRNAGWNPALPALLRQALREDPDVQVQVAAR